VDDVDRFRLTRSGRHVHLDVVVDARKILWTIASRQDYTAKNLANSLFFEGS
jgi:hypothetical protein